MPPKAEAEAKRTRGEKGGKRQKRRILNAQKKLDSGEIRIEDFDFSGPFEGWALDERKQLIPPSKQRKAEPEPAQEGEEGEPEADYDVDPPPSPESPGVQPAAKSVQSCQYKDIRLTDSTSSSEPRIVALDLHNTVDDGSRESRIPRANVEAIRRLLTFNVIIWVCSYIGKSLGQGWWRENESQRKRDAARQKIHWLADQLGLGIVCESNSPESGKLYLCITDRKLWSRNVPYSPLNGKSSALLANNTRILFDDCDEICREVESVGVLAYQIDSGRSDRGRYESRTLTNAGFYHSPSRDLPHAIEKFIADLQSGDVDRKLKKLAQAQSVF